VFDTAIIEKDTGFVCSHLDIVFDYAKHEVMIQQRQA